MIITSIIIYLRIVICVEYFYLSIHYSIEYHKNGPAHNARYALTYNMRIIQFFRKTKISPNVIIRSDAQRDLYLEY